MKDIIVTTNSRTDIDVAGRDTIIGQCGGTEVRTDITING